MSYLIEGEGLLLTGHDLLVIAAYVDRGIKYTRGRDSITPSPADIAVIRMLKQARERYRARMANVGHDQATLGPVEGASTQSSDREVNARGAAEIIGVTDRHIYRLIQTTDLAVAVVHDRPLLLDKALVEAYAADHPHRRSAAA